MSVLPGVSTSSLTGFWCWNHTGSHRNQCHQWIWHWETSLLVEDLSANNVCSMCKVNCISICIILTCYPYSWSNILVEDKKYVSTLWACKSGKCARILFFRWVEFTRPLKHVPSCSTLLEHILTRSASLNTGTFSLSFRASSIYATSSASAMPWLMVQLSFCSSDCLLDSVVQGNRHRTWYLASSAMRSPVLSLASRFWSCNCRAHSLTRASRPKVEALCNDSEAFAGFAQKKHCSVSSEFWAEHWWVFFLGASALSAEGAFHFTAGWSLVLLYCSRQLSCHLVLWLLRVSSISWPSLSRIIYLMASSLSSWRPTSCLQEPCTLLHPWNLLDI